MTTHGRKRLASRNLLFLFTRAAQHDESVKLKAAMTRQFGLLARIKRPQKRRIMLQR